jgi:two-component system cell cycle sensor histidine kinase/response regulator CckA
MERTSLEQWRAREVARLLSLVETERRYYQEIVASLPAALVVLNGDRTILSANRAFRQTVRLRNEDLRGRTIEQLFPSDELIEHIRSAHVGGNKDPFFVEVGERTYRFAIVPSQGWDDEGEPETILMIQDLTELDSAAGSKAVAPAGLPAIVWRADAATVRFLSVAGSAEELTGYAPSHWTSTAQFFWGRIHPEDLSQVKAAYQIALDNGGDATAEFRVLTASGEQVWLRETIRVAEPLADQSAPPADDKKRSSAPLAISGVATSVSRRKQLESQLLAASRVDAVHGLVGRLAHDLNNPLMIISGYGEDLLSTFPQQDSRRLDVYEILSASRRLTDLTGHLLNFARRQSEVASQVNLSKAIADLEVSLRQSPAHTPVTVDPGPSLLAMADPDQLPGTLSAIAGGALALTQNPSGLHISCQSDTLQEHIGLATLSPGFYARVSFRAFGSGLAETEDGGTPFESVLPSKGPKGAQSNALARAYAMVREWGGDITVSGDAQGALMVLYLMAVPAEPPPPSVLPAAASPQPSAPVAPIEQPAPEPELLRETILLVDDEAGIRGLVRRILRREHYHVIEAGSGEEALAIALQHPGPIHLLLTDVMMPGMSGPQLAQSVQGAFPSVKVVFISGYSQTEPTAQFPNALFLQKPFTMTDLLRIVRQAIESE